MGYLVGFSVLVLAVVLIIAGVKGNPRGLFDTITGQSAPQPKTATNSTPSGSRPASVTTPTLPTPSGVKFA